MELKLKKYDRPYIYRSRFILWRRRHNDGLSEVDMYSWFDNHPKKKNLEFHGQIISWSDKIDYGKPAGLEKEVVV